MNTIAINTPTDRRLAELETESQSIIEAYLTQVNTDAKSPNIKTLQNKLRDVRTEQWQLFDKTNSLLFINGRISAAA